MQLIKYDAACKALAEAKAVDEAKDIADKATALQAYATQAHNPELERMAAEIRLRAKRRIGEISASLEKKQNPHGKLPSGGKFKTDVLKDAGISTSEAHRCEKLAAIPADEFELRVSKVHVASNTGNNEWYTPSAFVEMARTVMGSIDTDPASSNIAQQCVKAKQHYTETDNGLEQVWAGNVWMNPPYSQPIIAEFAKTLIDKWEGQEFSQAIVLVNNATDSKWMQQMLLRADAVCFPEGRIKFIDEDGAPSGSPLQGQAFLYFGTDRKRFFEVFCHSGAVLFRGDVNG